jgi:hypothetical protein
VDKILKSTLQNFIVIEVEREVKQETENVKVNLAQVWSVDGRLIAEIGLPGVQLPKETNNG